MRWNLPAGRTNERARSSRVLRNAISGAAMAALALAFASCSHGHSHRDGAQQEYVVHLTNDLTPPSDVTVYAVAQDGTRQLLGDVPPNKDRALRIPNNLFPGTSFRIVAQRTAGRSVVSQPIAATNAGGIIDWDLQTNAVWFPEPAQ